MSPVCGFRRVIAVACLVLLAACAATRPAPSGEVRLDTVEPPDAERHELTEQEDFAAGVAISETLELPEYPPDLLPLRLPEFALCVELTVDERGVVEAVAALPAAPRCSAADDAVGQRFFAVTQEVVKRWRFTPSYVCNLPANAPADGTCEGEGITKQAIPLLRAYRFVFALSADGAKVSVGENAD